MGLFCHSFAYLFPTKVNSVSLQQLLHYSVFSSVLLTSTAFNIFQFVSRLLSILSMIDIDTVRILRIRLVLALSVCSTIFRSNIGCHMLTF